jgi:antitoxin (DNA-binding transcriptional repressor) of toxin-antitoxin stability system
MIRGMEPQVLHITEADLTRNVRAILQQVETGAETVIECDAQPVARLRAASPVRRTIAACIALAKAHKEETDLAPTLDPDFAADVEETVRNRQPWNPPAWD